jgi:hypothetical protein
MIAALRSGTGGMSCTRAATNASSSSKASARLCRRSNPMLDTGFDDSPRPQTDHE